MNEKVESEVKKANHLDERQARVAGFFEQMFWTNGTIPTNEVAEQALNEDSNYIKNLWKHEGFRTYLISRGVNLSPDSDSVLTPTQLLLVNVLLNSHDQKSVREKLKLVGVSSQQYHAWMRQGAFRSYVEKRAKDMFSSSEWQVKQSLTDVAVDGDVTAMKLFLEMTGAYTPRMDHTINLDSALSKIVEIVAKYVLPEVMVQISNDIERMLGGEEVDTRPVINLPSVPVQKELLPVGSSGAQIQI